MKERGRGRIVQIGSDIFERAVPGMSVYVAAKGAQLGLRLVVGSGAGSLRHHRELRRAGLDPGRAARGLPGRRPTPLSRRGAARPDGSAGRHRRGRVVPRVRLSILHHRRAADRERRPHDRLILLRKGASSTAAMAFEIASANLVVDFGVTLSRVSGWLQESKDAGPSRARWRGTPRLDMSLREARGHLVPALAVTPLRLPSSTAISTSATAIHRASDNDTG